MNKIIQISSLTNLAREDVTEIQHNEIKEYTDQGYSIKSVSLAISENPNKGSTRKMVTYLYLLSNE